MYLRRSWYVVGWSRELTDRPMTRTVMGEPIVTFRTADGGVVALEDRCPHRHLPLSMGKPAGNFIQCGYHGLTFDETGACVHAPSQAAIPANARIKSYPAAEKFGWIWVWMGERHLADLSLIPDFHPLDDPKFAAIGKTTHVEADYRLVTDNLMDLSHVGFVHTSTIGNAAMGEKGQITVTRRDNGVRVVRLVADVPPPPMYVKSGRLSAGVNIDRWQIIDFIAPCFVWIHVGGAPAGTGGLEGRYEHGLNMWVLNAMTPETATSTNYFWGSARSHALNDPEADAWFLAQVSEAFEEDRVILEGQQKVISARGDSWSVALQADAGSIQARRYLDRMLDEENRDQPLEAAQ